MCGSNFVAPVAAPEKVEILVNWTNQFGSWGMTYDSIADYKKVVARMARDWPTVTHKILKDSTKSLVDTTAASGHNTKKENTDMSFATPSAPITPATSVSVKKNVPAPAPVPPATYDINLTGLSARVVSRIRKVLENSGVSDVQAVATAIRQQTGVNGEFNSGLYVSKTGTFIRFDNK